MRSVKDSATETIARSRDTVMRAGKVARSAAVKAARAGAAAAVLTGSQEIRKGWEETDPATTKKSGRRKIAALVAGAAAVAAVGVAVSRSRSASTRKTASSNGKVNASTARLRKSVAKARKKVST